MTTARELIRAAKAAGAKLVLSGDRLSVSAPRPLAPELVEELRRAKPEILRLLAGESGTSNGHHRFPDGVAWWRNHFTIRTINRELDGKRGRLKAQRLAFNDLVDEWRKRYGRRWPAWQCAGCDEPIGGLSALSLADKNRVHFEEERECLIRFGQRWRGEAVAGLQGLGLEPPEGFDLL
jgi:hypothetical protein